MKRNSNHRHATRVIAATHHHFKMVKGLSTERGDLKHNVSMGLLIISTVLTLFGSIVRAIVVFQAREHKFASPAESIWFGYLCWGVFESIISILYIVCRVDLRFYRPDILPQAVRAIITAQQSYYPSDDESGDNDDNHNYKSEIIDKPEPQQQHVYAKHIGGFRGDENWLLMKTNLMILTLMNGIWGSQKIELTQVQINLLSIVLLTGKKEGHIQLKFKAANLSNIRTLKNQIWNFNFNN